jgi:hypothetical protein
MPDRERSNDGHFGREVLLKLYNQQVGEIRACLDFAHRNLSFYVGVGCTSKVPSRQDRLGLQQSQSLLVEGHFRLPGHRHADRLLKSQGSRRSTGIGGAARVRVGPGPAMPVQVGWE